VTTPTTCTLAYTIDIVGAQSQAQVHTEFAGVMLPIDQMENIGMSLTSDTTTDPTGTTTVRTLVFSLLPIFQSFEANTASSGFPGSIVSSSPKDAVGGTGAQRVQMFFEQTSEVSGRPVTQQTNQFATMNGTTPVPLLAEYSSDFSSITVVEAGSDGTNDGLIQVFTGPNASGGVMADLAGNFAGSILSTSPSDTALNVAGQLRGLQSVTITYHDKTGAGPFTETVSLNGTTPVNLVNTNKSFINGISVVTVGAIGGNVGTVTVMSGLNGTGGPVGLLQPSFFSYFPANPSLTSPEEQVALAAPVVDLFTHVLTAAMVSYVTASAPVFA
jgi:hypothetical protein